MQEGYCVILSKFRLYQGIALYFSLKANTSDFKFYVLCIDDEAYRILKALNFNDVVACRAAELENDELLALKRLRKLNEYCWTLKPVFLSHIMKREPKIRRVTYVDADIFFYADPAIVLKNTQDFSVLLSRHDYHTASEELTSVLQNALGKYNSGFISFRKDPVGCACLRWWRQKCMEWCLDKPIEGKFGDQKYLDEMAQKFEKVAEINHPGANVGPWNHGRYVFDIRNGRTYINNEDLLVFYHFSGFRMLNRQQYLLYIGLNERYIPMLHDGYGKLIQDIADMVSAIYPGFEGYILEENLRDGSGLILTVK